MKREREREREREGEGEGERERERDGGCCSTEVIDSSLENKWSTDILAHNPCISVFSPSELTFKDQYY